MNLKSDGLDYLDKKSTIQIIFFENSLYKQKHFWILIILATIASVSEILLLDMMSNVLGNNAMSMNTILLIIYPLVFLFSTILVNYYSYSLTTSLLAELNLKIFDFFQKNYANRKHTWNLPDVNKYLTNMSNRVFASIFNPAVLSFVKTIFLINLFIFFVYTVGSTIIISALVLIIISYLLILALKPVFTKLGKKHLVLTNSIIDIVDDYFGNFKSFTANNFRKSYKIKYFKILKDFKINQTKILTIPTIIKSIIDFSLFTAIIGYSLLGDMITKSDTSLIIVTAFIIMRSLPAVQVLWNASNQINSSKHIYIKLLKVIKSGNNSIDDSNFSLISEISNHDLIKINEIQLDINEFKLKIPSISFKKGDRIRVSGESGSGKTTFIDLLAGLYPFFTSNINTNLTKKRIKIEYCTQSIQLAHGTILSNLIPHSIEPPSQNELNKVYRLLDKLNLTRTINNFGGFEMIVGRNNNPFSGGELKRFGIAKSLMSKADLYIFDEPEQGLDIINISNVYDEIFKLKSAVIIVSHNKFRLSDFNIKLNVQNGIITSVN